MNKPGMTPATAARIEQVCELLRQGNKLTWSLAQVGLSYYVWYRWAGAKAPAKPSLARLPRAEVTSLVARVDALMFAQGMSKAEACREVGLSYTTYWFRKAKEARPA